MIYTIGHSNRSLDDLAAALAAHDIARVIDVRRRPGSRRHPQFSRQSLEVHLPATGIDYVWEERLGAMRSRAAASPHTALEEPAFAAYADHMMTDEFRAAIGDAIERSGPVALMCAERDPAHCHRSMISDWLVAHTIDVTHVIDANTSRPHRLAELARVEGDHVIYDRGQLSLC